MPTNNKNDGMFSFTITHDCKTQRPRQFYHRKENVILEWVRLIKQQAVNISFDDQYLKGRKLGSGKFSTVYQCQNKFTQEIAAVKVIEK